MNILCVGDIVGKVGRDVLIEHLPKLKKEYKLDFIIVNAENSAGGFGITERIANELFAAGCNVITLGDHVWDKREIAGYLQEHDNILRPANFPNGAPGFGWSVQKANNGQKIAVITLLGRVFMRYNVDCPFRTLKSIVSEVKKETNNIIVELHAETTSEKNALAFYMDGQVSAVFGTHTHIPTADERVLPNGTAFVTDLGMTGPYDSVIGQKKEIIIERFLTSMPSKFEVSTENVCLHGALIDVDEATGLARQITRIQRRASNGRMGRSE